MYHEKKICRVAFLVIGLLLAVTLASPAIAEMYTYTGALFDDYDNRYGYDYTGMTNISGIITTPSLLAPSTTYDWSWDSGNAPPAYSFTDGQHVVTNAGYDPGHNGTLLAVTTDAGGHINAWWIDIYTANYPGPPYPSADFFFHGSAAGGSGDSAFTEGLPSADAHGFYASVNASDFTEIVPIGSWTGGGTDGVGDGGDGGDGGGGGTVPEPSTMLLLASGLFGLAALRKKFKN